LIPGIPIPKLTRITLKNKEGNILSKHGSSAKAIMYAFLANFGIAVAKGVAAFYTGSGSMLAEAIHSLADCTNQVLLFLGLKRSEKPATHTHPLGYGKVIYFWSFIVAVLLFSMGGLFSIYEGVHKLNHPEELNRVWVALLVLGVSIILESLSLFGALREIKHVKKGKSLGEWIKTTVRAELLVVFGEDIAALLGLTVAFIFVLLAFLTGNPLYDSLGSICIGGILVLVSLFLIIRL
jgi:cation diffusion facilitator family transporter